MSQSQIINNILLIQSCFFVWVCKTFSQRISDVSLLKMSVSAMNLYWNEISNNNLWVIMETWLWKNMHDMTLDEAKRNCHFFRIESNYFNGHTILYFIHSFSLSSTFHKPHFTVAHGQMNEQCHTQKSKRFPDRCDETRSFYYCCSQFHFIVCLNCNFISILLLYNCRCATSLPARGVSRSWQTCRHLQWSR